MGPPVHLRAWSSTGCEGRKGLWRAADCPPIQVTLWLTLQATCPQGLRLVCCLCITLHLLQRSKPSKCPSLDQIPTDSHYSKLAPSSGQTAVICGVVAPADVPTPLLLSRPGDWIWILIAFRHRTGKYRAKVCRDGSITDSARALLRFFS